MDKKANVGLGQLPAFVWILVLIGISLTIGLTVMGKMRDVNTADTAEYNASVDTIAAMDDIPDWLPVIVVVVIAVIVVGLIAFFRMRSA